MKIIAVIPARYKSSRFPGKPLVDILGRPMIARVHDRVAHVATFDRVLVATDDERIDSACRELGIATMMTRDDHKTGTDRVAEVATREPADLYVNVQGDEPLLESNVIEAAVAPFLDGTAAPRFQVVNLMTRIKRLTDLVDSTVPKVVVNQDGDAVYLSRSPIPYPKDNTDEIDYYKQVCVYAFTPDSLAAFARLPQGPCERAEGIELLRFIEHGIGVRMLAVDHDTVAVDTPSDLELVRRIYARSVA